MGGDGPPVPACTSAVVCSFVCLLTCCLHPSVAGKEDPAKKGICSNFLCDAKPGQEITMTGG